MTTELDYVAKRNIYHNTLDRLIDFIVTTDPNDLRTTDVTTRIQKIRELESKFDKVQDNVEDVRRENEEYSEERPLTLSNQEQRAYEEKLMNALAEYNHAYVVVDKRENPQRYQQASVARIMNESQQQVSVPQRIRDVQVRLPKIELLTFPGTSYLIVSDLIPRNIYCPSP